MQTTPPSASSLASNKARFTFFPNDQAADKTNIFLNIEKKVFYMDSENEQGMLGLAFHPKYKTNGEFFVFYTLKTDKTTKHYFALSRSARTIPTSPTLIQKK